jgi:hypothetical protein
MGSDSNLGTFFEELKRLGYVEGINLIVDRYSAEGNFSRYADLARDVVSTHPDLIFTTGAPLTLRLKAATSTIPIVTITGDPIRQELYRALRGRATTSRASALMLDLKSGGCDANLNVDRFGTVKAFDVYDT